MSSMPSIAFSAGDQPVQVAPHERLAAGQPDRAHADGCGRANDLRDFFVAQDLVALQPGKPASGMQ